MKSELRIKKWGIAAVVLISSFILHPSSFSQVSYSRINSLPVRNSPQATDSIPAADASGGTWRIPFAKFGGGEAMIFNMKNPYGTNSAGGTALQELVTSLVAAWPGRLGLMNPDLFYGTHQIGTNTYIAQYHLTQPVGYQFRSPVAGGNAGPLCDPAKGEPQNAACLSAVIANSDNLGAHWLHAYYIDTNSSDSTYQTALTNGEALFTKWAWLSPNLQEILYASK